MVAWNGVGSKREGKEGMDEVVPAPAVLLLPSAHGRPTVPHSSTYTILHLSIEYSTVPQCDEEQDGDEEQGRSSSSSSRFRIEIQSGSGDGSLNALTSLEWRTWPGPVCRTSRQRVELRMCAQQHTAYSSTAQPIEAAFQRRKCSP